MTLKRNVNIYWIRHGESCANAIQRYKPWYQQYKRAFGVDPPLTDGALERIEKLRKEKKHMPPAPQIVISSKLLRAMQTAQALYPRKKIYTMCGLEEQVGGPSNRPGGHEYQKKFLKNPKNFIHQRLRQKKDFDKLCRRMGAKNPKTFFGEEGYEQEYDLKAFLIRFIDKNEWPSSRPINVVVVGHSHWLRNHFKNQKLMRKNLQIVREKFILHLDEFSFGINRKPNTPIEILYEGNKTDSTKIKNCK